MNNWVILLIVSAIILVIGIIFVIINTCNWDDDVCGLIGSIAIVLGIIAVVVSVFGCLCKSSAKHTYKANLENYEYYSYLVNDLQDETTILFLQDYIDKYNAWVDDVQEQCETRNNWSWYNTLELDCTVFEKINYKDVLIGTYREGN